MGALWHLFCNALALHYPIFVKHRFALQDVFAREQRAFLIP